MHDNGRPLTTGDVARYCGVSRMGALRWIRQGKLKAYSTPGGHYRIQVDDFRDFLRRFDIPVDVSFLGRDTKRILVLATDTFALGTIVRSLSAMGEGYEIDIAADRVSALVKIADFGPALIILNTRASKIEALKMLLWIRDHVEASSAPVLLLTKSVMREAELKSEEQESVSLVWPAMLRQSLPEPVPLEAETLQAAVRRLLAM